MNGMSCVILLADIKQCPNIWIDDTSTMSLQHIQSECRKIKRKIGDIGFIDVDYLTLMQADRNDLTYGNYQRVKSSCKRARYGCGVINATEPKFRATQ